MEECRELRARSCPHGLPCGQVVATGAGKLPAKTGDPYRRPESSAGTERSSDARVLRRDLARAVNVRARSVAFPSDSMGVYEWDAAEVARIAVAAVGVSPHLGELDLVGFIPFSPASHEGFIAALR